MYATSERAARTCADSAVVPQVKGQVYLEGKMDVDRAREKRQHAERETHDEAEQVKIRPGHTAPRAHHPCASWNPVRRPLVNSVAFNSLTPAAARCAAARLCKRR